MKSLSMVFSGSFPCKGGNRFSLQVLAFEKKNVPVMVDVSNSSVTIFFLNCLTPHPPI